MSRFAVSQGYELMIPQPSRPNARTFIAQLIYGLMKSMDLHAVRLEIPAEGNIIVGHSHFIKTVEDVYEAIVNTVPQMKFGIAFSEASGACLIRVEGNEI